MKKIRNSRKSWRVRAASGFLAVTMLGSHAFALEAPSARYAANLQESYLVSQSAEGAFAQKLPKIFYAEADVSSETVAQMQADAEQGDAEAQVKLGFYYYNQKDYEQALQWFRKAAEQGDATAQNNIGFCYHNGYGVEVDYEQAVEWYQKAVDQGFAAAQCNFGACYYNGHGVEKDYEQAVEWYQKAADQGLAAAQYNLGRCFEKGYGVTQDDEQAAQWYQKAANQGHADAQKALDALTAPSDAATPAEPSTPSAPSAPAEPSTPAAPAVSNPFTDVKQGDDFYDAVLWAISQGITDGTTTRTFSPSDTCTQAQLLTFIWRAQGQPEPTAFNPFGSMTGSEYYYKAALWAYENGLVGSSFEASAPCTQSMVITCLWKTADSGEADDVTWAANTETCTRGQVVTLLYRVLA